MKKFLFILFLFFVFIFLITCITTLVVYSDCSVSTYPTQYCFSNTDYVWPLPGYHTISSNFGVRISPTTGASKYHSGIDIPAPEGTSIYSVSSGVISYLDFNGANGYTIIIESGNTIFSYSHVSPNFIIKIGDFINKNQFIGNVGSKYISGISNNPYKDSTR